jgi:hypothetical protein|uniref:Uncharacterized protein n=1 Tax=Schizaphis graminum TaxID=13262 RepID=A0A2S2PJR3_SCHGA
MSSAILDVHCILGAGKKYFIKEMTIIDIESSFNQHWIFKHTSLKQDAKSRSVNSWLQRLHHGLSLDYGDVEYEEIHKIFQSLKFKRIYVKGLYKQRIIIDFMPHATVFDLENSECPRLCQLTRGETLACCNFHMDFNPQQCTLNKVFALKKWYANNL